MAVKPSYSNLMLHLKRLNAVCSGDKYSVFIRGDGKYYLLAGRFLVFETESIYSLITKIRHLSNSSD